MSTNFEQIMRQARASHCKRLAVACAQDGPVLQAVSHARRMGIAEAILVGDAEAISRVASAEGIDISGMTVVDEPDDYTAALRAVAMVRRGDADMYMKGIIDTRSFLRSVLDQECGLRTGRMMSHVVVMDLPSAGRLLLLTDVAFNPAPTLDEKCRLIENAVEVANACGLTMPRVAPLAAVEVVNPKMPCTVEADRLTQMNLAGQIGGCIVDGPLSLDLAIDPEAARRASPHCRQRRHTALSGHSGRQHHLQVPRPHHRLPLRLHPDRHRRSRHTDLPLRRCPHQGQLDSAGSRGGRPPRAAPAARRPDLPSGHLSRIPTPTYAPRRPPVSRKWRQTGGAASSWPAGLSASA